MQTNLEQYRYSLLWTIFQMRLNGSNKNATLLKVIIFFLMGLLLWWRNAYEAGTRARIHIWQSLPRPRHRNRDMRHPQKVSLWQYSLDLRMRWRNYKREHDHVHWNLSRFRVPWALSETLPTATRDDLAPGMASRVRMTQSALQKTCAVYVLFAPRRISDRLENVPCRLDLVLVWRSECVSFVFVCLFVFCIFAAN